MPAKKSRYCYWDSCVFLAYTKGEPGRVDVIDALWDDFAENKDDRIVTSIVSVTEVAHVGLEKDRRILELDGALKLDAMWRHTSVLMAETNEKVVYMARDLMRDATSRQWSLTPLDAIQLATCKWIHDHVHAIDEFQTYDRELEKYSALIGIPVTEPRITKPTQTQLDLRQDTKQTS